MREPKTWVFGDVHGAYLALKQVFERAPIQEGDTIISLGDIADGWPDVYECVELLLSMKEKYNMIFIKGNHDDWLLTWLQTGTHPSPDQGGRASIHSYMLNCNGGVQGLVIPDEHRRFFKYQHNYYKDDEGRLFIHGGFNRHKLLKDEADQSIFWWDRDLWHTALSYQAMNKGLVYHYELEGEEAGTKKNVYHFKIKEPVIEIFIGHTTTGFWSQIKPMHAGPIWNLDTGAGFEGVLTIMDVDTHEYWQSDHTKDLYPGEVERTQD